MNKKIIVFGGTGKTGTQIIECLQSAKLDFLLFIREQSVAKLAENGYSIIQGDVLNQEDLNTAFNDHDFTDIIISLGSQALKNTGIRANGTRNVIQALQSNNKTATIHVVSALGVGESINQLKWYNKFFANVLLKNVMLDHHAQEAIVRESKLQYHIIRPVGLKDGPPLGKVHVQSEGYLPKDTIKRADVAKYLVDSILDQKTGISNISQAN